MNNRIWFIFLTALLSFLSTKSFSQSIPIDSLYLGQAVPSNTPKIFLLSTTAQLRACERIAISNDGKEIYFGELNTYPASVYRVKVMKYKENRWQGPFVAFEGFMAPRFAQNDSLLYLQDNAMGTFYSLRTDSGWTVPARVHPQGQHTHYYQKTNYGTYASSFYEGSPTDGDICKVSIVNSSVVLNSLGAPLNTSFQENDFYISPNEDYIIYSKNQTGGAGDMYISYKKTNAKWTNPKKLNPPYSLSGLNWEYGEYVSPDGKYLFFTRGSTSMGSYYTYWVRIDNLVDSLKHTNFLPFVSNIIPNKTVNIGESFQFALPDSIFTDDDGNNTLRYSATLNSGEVLPAWLVFDSLNRVFHGTPTEAQNLTIKVIATDSANQTVSTTFNIAATTTDINEQIGEAKKTILYQNYPNPFSNKTSITYQIPESGLVSLKVCSLLGTEIATLANDFETKGTHSVTFDSNNYSTGVYFYTLSLNGYTSTKKMIIVK